MQTPSVRISLQSYNTYSSATFKSPNKDMMTKQQLENLFFGLHCNPMCISVHNPPTDSLPTFQLTNQ